MECLQDGRPPRSELSWDLIYLLSTISLQITKNPEPDYPMTFHLATVSNRYSIGIELYNPYYFYRWSRRMAQMHPMMIAPSKFSSTKSNCFFKEVYHYVVGHWSLNVTAVNPIKCVLDLFFLSASNQIIDYKAHLVVLSECLFFFFCSTDITFYYSSWVSGQFLCLSLSPFHLILISQCPSIDKISLFQLSRYFLFRWSAMESYFTCLQAV